MESAWVEVCVCTSTRALMVEEYSITSKDIVSLAIVDHNPISIQLGCPVRRARIERCCLRLGNLPNLAKQLASRRL